MIDKRTPLARVTAAIVGCNRCTRLRHYCAEVAREKKAAHREDVYWGKPVPGVWAIRRPASSSLVWPRPRTAPTAPAVIPRDGVGASGDFLMSALHRAGYANIATSQRIDDGLWLEDVYRGSSALRSASQQGSAR